MFEDKTLVCRDCGKEFVWTAGEQEFYASRGFENQPQRCKACRDARKNAVRGERQMFDAVCAACGKACKVPFQPREDRPVYCSECFAKMKQNLSTIKPPPALGRRRFSLVCIRRPGFGSVPKKAGAAGRFLRGVRALTARAGHGRIRKITQCAVCRFFTRILH